jgi:endonuclease III
VKIIKVDLIFYFMLKNQKIAIKQLLAIEKKIPVSFNSMRLAAEGWDENWKCLISIILSAQSRDSKTIKVCEKLFKIYKTPKEIGKAPINEIEEVIKSINYYKSKSNYIKKTCEIISKNGIPKNLENLVKLPGVGRKTANVYLSSVHKKQAIGVDTHVARISLKLGWTNKKTEQRDKIEEDLKKLFPKKYWSDINNILVRFGQTIGRSRKKEDEIITQL